MKLRCKITVLAALFLGMVYSCKEEPKYTPISSGNNNSVENPMEQNSLVNQTLSNELHTVVVKEVLPTIKYVYLNVEENGEQFWIATGKQEIKIGETYYYKRSLLKTNFESKEHNRIFSTILLVSNLIDGDHSQHTTQKAVVEESVANTVTNVEVENSIRIGDLVASSAKYATKKIQVSGVVMKVNNNIMGKNWVHLDDGTNDGFDLIVTTNETFHKGQTVTMTGVVAINKDFGAGYKFDIIVEEGVVVTQ